MKRLMLIVMSVAVCLCCAAQDYDHYYDKYLREAREHLASGNIEKAEQAYGIFTGMTGQSDRDFERELAAKKTEAAVGNRAEPVLRWNAQTHTLTYGNYSYKMVYVPGGTFKMGATGEQGNPDSDEKPVHRVTLDSYYIGATEVPQWLWMEVMGRIPCHWEGDKLPVENVSWDDCQNFISKLNSMTGANFKLPTEAQWEYAARGGASGGTKYAGSSDINDVAWYKDNSDGRTHEVGKKDPNALGLYDMTGNVWEWCSDWYGNDYYNNSPLTNPTGPSTGSDRVLRGGSWISSAAYCRVANRSYSAPGGHSDFLGLRLAL